MPRLQIASSHDGRFTYWQDSDRYIYQRDETAGVWIGWLCSLGAWESTFCHAAWITLREVPA